ncbi:hypothetical protein AWR38_11215 [Idiomarina sp. WRN-38]|jgi:hypothetical protein|uniref:DUF6436 domain-containing protein n=1 Tax=Halomonadaceae TaxID=28256 RepID=UPI00073398C9|nr:MULTISPECIES: DUF6436 domain-containing protein [Halomonas]KTG29320.1 hypothetical protein AUR68_11200 [Idiomarina sp. H105]MAY33075.1 hypothetical protein [Rhodovulum sp.]OAF11418.1 hypothetical protein AWR38_11215 [Idiomarina sp. WRN-38]MCO7244347.1 DUF6436 domain-containing protein [Halomonas sp. Ps84H-12]MDK2751989.1 DUF6436 domain-containing protein [Halomonas meridiana]|tara:strand:+ start:2692 stop:3279 length:588 start_codon:yes stop_codon:yes gene_type:complete
MQPKTVGVSLVVCWGVLIAIAFWLFAYKDLRLFADDEVFARFPEEVASTAISTSPLPENATGRLVNFWNPDCRCSRFSQAHIEEIMQAYAGQGIEFVVAVPRQSLVDQALTTFPKASSAVVVEQLEGLSTPSAAVFDARSTLVYFGPYSDGAFCTSGGSTPVELILNDVVAPGEVAPWLNLSAFGCYCDWPTARS